MTVTVLEQDPNTQNIQKNAYLLGQFAEWVSMS